MKLKVELFFKISILVLFLFSTNLNALSFNNYIQTFTIEHSENSSNEENSFSFDNNLDEDDQFYLSIWLYLKVQNIQFLEISTNLNLIHNFKYKVWQPPII